MDRVEGKNLLRSGNSTLAERMQVRQSPGIPLFPVTSSARRVEPAPKLAGAQKLLHLAPHEDEVQMVVLETRCDVHHGVLGFDPQVVLLPRLHTLAHAPGGPDVEDGAADGRVDGLRGFRLARLR